MSGEYWYGFVCGMTVSAALLVVAVAIMESALRNLSHGLATIAALLREKK